MNCKAFNDFLLRAVEKLDQKVIENMHPSDSQWIGTVTTGVCQPSWWESRETVRRLSEGSAFSSSKPDKSIPNFSTPPEFSFPVDLRDPHGWAKFPC